MQWIEAIEQIEDQYERVEAILADPKATQEIKDKAIEIIRRLDKLVERLQQTTVHLN